MRSIRVRSSIVIASAVGLTLMTSGCPRGSGTTGQQGSGAKAGDTAAEGPAVEPPALAEVEPSSLDRDEVVLFLPTYATAKDGQWQVPVEAWVFEPEEDSLRRQAIVKLVGEGLESVLDGPESDVLAKNLRPFVVDNERDEWVAVRRGAHAMRVGPTAANGRARGVLPIPAGDPAATGEGTPPWVELSVVMPSDDTRTFSAWSQLLGDEGISVISDIDDTIKITEVLDKKKLLVNTLMRPPQAVPGMADAYRRWADQGVAFHYVSASPLPLLEKLTGFIQDAGFPRGSLSLRPFRWVDGTAIELAGPSEDYKREVIGGVLGAFDQRRFVLVGDTGERDPEIYAAMAREHSKKVRAIILRDPTPGGTPGITERMRAVFEGLPDTLWTVVADGTALPEAP